MIIHGIVKNVIDNIREQIITGDLAAGKKLNEIELAASFNISRPPLREAFRTLESERLAISIPRKGCFVSKITLEDLNNVFEARMMIESFALGILKKKNLTEIPEVASAVSQTNKLGPIDWDLTNKKARIQYLISLAAFHIKLVEAAGNNILTKFHQTIVHNLVRYQYKYPYHQPERFKQSQRAHEKIMEEIQKAAFDQAKATLTEHHYAFMEIVRKRMLEENLS